MIKAVDETTIVIVVILVGIVALWLRNRTNNEWDPAVRALNRF